MSIQFNAALVAEDIINWIRNWFEQNGKGCNAVVGISGGKDSSVVAALCVRALGRERVIGVMMPRGEQFDIDVSKRLIAHLGIRGIEYNIASAYDAMMSELSECIGEVSEQTRINIQPRIRMTVLYAVSQSCNGRVANTCNLSEDWVGYSTRYGDSAGDFSPLSRITVAEVKEIGRYLGLPEEFVEKTPIDGLSGKSDEEKLGFTYATLDRYIREGIIDDAAVKERIDHLHRINLFKLRYMDCFEYDPK